MSIKNKILVFIITAILVFNNISIVFAEQNCKIKVDGYTIKNNVNMDISRIEIGETANISIDIIDDIIKTSDVSSSQDISVTNVDGCFGSSDPNSVDITSSNDENLSYTINFKNVEYTGTGRNMKFKIKYKNLNIASDIVSVEINECSPNEFNDDPIIDNETNKQPFVEISRNNIEKPIKANESFTLQLIIRNRGSAKMKRPVMTISLPDSIYSLDGMGSIQIPDIESGTSKKVTLKLKAEQSIESASEVIDIILNYNYNSGSDSSASGSYSDRIFIPMVPTEKTAAPIIQILKDTFFSPVNANEEFILPITIKNIGQTEILSPMLYLTPSDETILLDDSSAISIPAIKPNEEFKQNVKFKTKKYISNSSQEISAEVKYSYKSDKDFIQASDTAKLTVPTNPNDSSEASEPLIQIITENIDNTLKSNETFSIKTTIKNIGSTDIDASVFTWEPNDGVIITDKTASINIGELKAGDSKEIILKGKLSDKITTTTQIVNGEFKYKYQNGKTASQGQEAVKVIIPTQPDKEEEEEEENIIKSATPNIIVSNYNYGGVPIANGETFNFDVSFKNTSKELPVENIVMSIETDAGVSIRSASNTYYYEKMQPLGDLSETIEMQVLPSAETGSVNFTINFSYEYLEKDKKATREQVKSSQSVSIPVYKPDKLEIELEPLPIAYANNEQTVTLNYVNKGKGELSNVKAEIIGDINALTSTQNLGNFEPGKSGTINFVVIPTEIGEINFTVTVSYEDANFEQKTLEFPCVMNVEESYDEFADGDIGMMEEEEPSEGMGITTIILICIAVLVVVGTIVILYIKRRRKKRADIVSIDWGSDNEDK